MKIGFVVDSACDVPPQYVERYGVNVVPAFVNYNDQSFADDGEGLNRKSYYEELEKIRPIPQTSSMSPGIAQAAIEEVLADHDHVMIFTVAADLSGIHNTMRLAAQQVAPGKHTMFDTEQLSMGGGYQAIVAMEAAARGDDIETIKKLVEKAKDAVSMYAAMQGVEFLRRGGRVGWTAGMIGNLLNIRPIVRVGEGKVNSAKRVRTRQAWIDAMANYAREAAPLERVMLLHTNNEEDLDALRAKISDILPEHVDYGFVTPSVGTHTGPGAIGIAFLPIGWDD